MTKLYNQHFGIAKLDTSTDNDRTSTVKERVVRTNNAMHKPPSREVMEARASLLMEERNINMLASIARELVDTYEDREELVASLSVQLVTAPTLSAAAAAAALLYIKDGDEGRRMLYERCRKLGYNEARVIYKRRGREVSCNYELPLPTTPDEKLDTVTRWTNQQEYLASMETDVQAQARMAALAHDGRVARLDKDSASWINRKRTFDNWHPPMSVPHLAWSERDFHRSAERIQEQSSPWSGWSKVSVGQHWASSLSRGMASTPPSDRGHLDAVFNKGFVRLVRERSSLSMLAQDMRTHGLHDFGRLDRVDKLTYSNWHQRFVSMQFGKNDKDLFSDKDANTFVKQLAARCDLSQTTWVRQAATMMLWLGGCRKTDHGWIVKNDDDATVVAIAEGHVWSIGSLVEACTSGTTKQSRGNNVATGESMRIRWATMLRVMGFENTTVNRNRLAGLHTNNPKTRMIGLVERMAIEAGASPDIDMLHDSSITLERF